ncbi:MAG: DsbE family thiol:disulfide interchange protein [Thiotrichales bacterium]
MRWLPVALFLVLAGFLYRGLWLDPREVPSPFIGKPAPGFSLPVVGRQGVHFGPEQAKGSVWVLNVWAPWCTTCRREHLHLMDLAARIEVPIIGLNWKDTAREAAGYLAQHGNPYAVVVDDREGRVGIDYGVTGVPETLLVDAEGVIRLKHSGPVTPRVWRERFEPLIEAMRL